LRATVTRLLEAKPPAPTLGELIRFNEAIDQALVESVSWYAVQLEHSRELFLAILGHDLRNPLGAMLMLNEVILSDTRLSSASTMAAVRVMNSGTRMSRMIEDLIDFTRTRLGTKLPIERSRIELGALMRQTADELHALHPTRDIHVDSPGAWVWACTSAVKSRRRMAAALRLPPRTPRARLSKSGYRWQPRRKRTHRPLRLAVHLLLERKTINPW